MLNKHYDNLFEVELDTMIKKEKTIDNQYHTVFNDTLFYVKSGGMESDRGFINNEELLDIYVEDNEVWHVTKSKLNDPIHIQVDLNYRLFKSQIHSAQHLMCTIMNTDYHAKTIMFKTGELESEIEMGFDSLNRDILNEIERKCNEHIREDISIVISYPTKEEALENIWEDYGDDFDWNTQLRSVAIPGIDYDLCACIHVPSLRYIQGIKFLGYEKTTRGFKISFVAGSQLFDYIQKHYDVFHEASKSLAIAQLEINESIQKLFQEKKDLTSSLNDYKQKYFDFLAKDLCATPNTYLFEEFNSMDIKSFQQLCSTITNHYDKGIIFVLKIDEKCHVVVAKNKSIDIQANEIFKSIAQTYELKGGGNPVISQGGGIYSSDLVNHCKSLINKMNEA
ncbi:alanyl-tRNA editing protein [Anaerorhabdus furcosa]|uniref:DHHA1 domain n=1 Tax=Anaerorhabdus furcosa TaxID=118967 RepID=A0A1T4LBQ2_9FIRM|nr:DHHA1 domain-containing protein [Anaerorhabdus furcosa]SJZ52081.1 DHHA1 domain [Anaerorhabdus furcosa]